MTNHEAGKSCVNVYNNSVPSTERYLQRIKNQLIEETLEAFDITRSFSHKECPYDNAVAEATFKIIKTEFVKNQTFMNLDALKLQLADSVNWFNNHRIHSSLRYKE